MRILFLSRWFPYPTDNGSKLRIWNLLRGLSEFHEVSLLSFADVETADQDAPELQELCTDIQVIPWKAYNPQSSRARLGFLQMKPRSYIDTYSQEMESAIAEKLESDRYDIVIASEWEMASYSSCIREHAALFEDVELGVLYGKYAGATSLPHKLRHGLTYQKHRFYLGRLLKDFDACTVPSQIEYDLLTRAVPNYEHVSVVPNCINLAEYDHADIGLAPNSLIFTGSFRYAVNHEAMVWFIQEIYPLVQSQIPDVHLSITGDHDGKELPSTTGVTLTGFVPEIRPFIASSWASIVPLRSGGGTRIKILEAMALKTPVITTTKGAEGLDVRHGDTVLIADDPEDFAAATIRLLREPELRTRLVDNAYQLVRDTYDWAGAMPRFLQLIEDTADSARKYSNRLQ